MNIRPASKQDAVPLSDLLNEIIQIGGTTARQTPNTPKAFAQTFLHGENFICCFVAEAPDGSLAGFQHLERIDRLPEGWASIATFARVTDKIPGVGTALFAKTLDYAKSIKLIAIDATIRADNLGGLGFYSKMGFEDYEVHKAIPLTDGTPVDRISKRYLIG